MRKVTAEVISRIELKTADIVCNACGESLKAPGDWNYEGLHAD